MTILLLASYGDDIGLLTLLGIVAALFPLFVMIHARIRASDARTTTYTPDPVELQRQRAAWLAWEAAEAKRRAAREAAEAERRAAREARRAQRRAEQAQLRAERAAYYKSRGIEPGRWAWFKALPDLGQALILGLAIAVPLGGIAIVAFRAMSAENGNPTGLQDATPVAPENQVAGHPGQPLDAVSQRNATRPKSAEPEKPRSHEELVLDEYLQGMAQAHLDARTERGTRAAEYLRARKQVIIDVLSQKYSITRQEVGHIIGE